MTETSGSFTRFWFAPASTATLALVRIAVGAVTLGWAVSLGPDVLTFYGRDGIVGVQPRQSWHWSLFDMFHQRGAVVVVWVLLVVAAFCVMVGLGTRLAVIVAFLAVLSFERRNPWVVNAGDVLLRNALFYLVLAPAGASLSVDRWLRHREDFWQFPSRAIWVLRLVQIQLCVVYVGTVWAKLRGDTWNNGTAVSYALRIGDLARFHPPAFLTDSLLVSNLLTFGTLAVEASIGILVWNRRVRPWVLALGAGLHIFIDLTLDVGFFSWVMLALYVSFVPPDTAERWILAVRRRVRRADPVPAGPLRRRAPVGAGARRR